jgi:hypothetical protein
VISTARLARAALALLGGIALTFTIYFTSVAFHSGATNDMLGKPPHQYAVGGPLRDGTLYASQPGGFVDCGIGMSEPGGLCAGQAALRMTVDPWPLAANVVMTAVVLFVVFELAGILWGGVDVALAILVATILAVLTMPPIIGGRPLPVPASPFATAAGFWVVLAALSILGALAFSLLRRRARSTGGRGPASPA